MDFQPLYSDCCVLSVARKLSGTAENVVLFLYCWMDMMHEIHNYRKSHAHQNGLIRFHQYLVCERIVHFAHYTTLFIEWHLCLSGHIFRFVVIWAVTLCNLIGWFQCFRGTLLSPSSGQNWVGLRKIFLERFLCLCIYNKILNCS